MLRSTYTACLVNLSSRLVSKKELRRCNDFHSAHFFSGLLTMLLKYVRFLFVEFYVQFHFLSKYATMLAHINIYNHVRPIWA